MFETSRMMMQGALCAMLNTVLASHGIRNVRVTKLSDNFESAFLLGNDGTKGVVGVDAILRIAEEEHGSDQEHIDQGLSRIASRVA